MPQVAQETNATARIVRTPLKLLGGAVAILAALAGVISNTDKIRDFLTPSLEGEWVMTDTIKDSAFSPFKGLVLTYVVFLTQNGRQVSGTGEKTMENGKEIPARAHSPIEILGGIDGSKIVARFVLKPAPNEAARETRGQFEWRVVREGFLRGRAVRLEGNFNSTGASSSGTSIAVRAPGS